MAVIRARLLEKRIEQERLRTGLKAAAKIQKLFWPKMPANVNNAMYELMSDEVFFATQYYANTGLALDKYTSCGPGLYPPWVTNFGCRELPKLDGISLGVEFGTEYEKTVFDLSPGEAILFITDGVTEAENEECELFGDDRLTDHFEAVNSIGY